jgi:hypothetical protein
VVVDHIENDADAEGVCPVVERTKVGRRAVQSRRGVEVDAVISPAEPPGEVRHRHHLDHGDAKPRQLLQLAGGGAPCAFSRERADVHLVDHLPLARDAGPP